MGDTKNMFSVMQAFSDGRSIERQSLTNDKEWIGVKNPTWNWEKYTYRVSKADNYKSIIENVISFLSEEKKLSIIFLNDSGHVVVTGGLKKALETKGALVVSHFGTPEYVRSITEGL